MSKKDKKDESKEEKAEPKHKACKPPYFVSSTFKSGGKYYKKGDEYKGKDAEDWRERKLVKSKKDLENDKAALTADADQKRKEIDARREKQRGEKSARTKREYDRIERQYKAMGRKMPGSEGAATSKNPKRDSRLGSRRVSG